MDTFMGLERRLIYISVRLRDSNSENYRRLQPYLVFSIGYWVVGLAYIQIPTTNYAGPGGWALMVPLRDSLCPTYRYINYKRRCLRLRSW